MIKVKLDKGEDVRLAKGTRLAIAFTGQPRYGGRSVCMTARLLACKGPRNSVRLLLLTAPRNSRRLGRVYDPEDVVLEITLTAGAALDALTKAIPVGVRYTVGPRGRELSEG